MGVIVIRSDDSGAPVLTGEKGRLLSVLNSVISSNIPSMYSNVDADVLTVQTLTGEYRISQTYDQFAEVRIYDSNSYGDQILSPFDLTANPTLSNFNMTDSSIRFFASSTSDNTVRPWIIVADDEGIVFISFPTSTGSAIPLSEPGVINYFGRAKKEFGESSVSYPLECVIGHNAPSSFDVNQSGLWGTYDMQHSLSIGGYGLRTILSGYRLSHSSSWNISCINPNGSGSSSNNPEGTEYFYSKIYDSVRSESSVAYFGLSGAGSDVISYRFIRQISNECSLDNLHEVAGDGDDFDSNFIVIRFKESPTATEQAFLIQVSNIDTDIDYIDDGSGSYSFMFEKSKKLSYGMAGLVGKIVKSSGVIGLFSAEAEDNAFGVNPKGRYAWGSAFDIASHPCKNTGFDNPYIGRGSFGSQGMTLIAVVENIASKDDFAPVYGISYPIFYVGNGTDKTNAVEVRCEAKGYLENTYGDLKKDMPYVSVSARVFDSNGDVESEIAESHDTLHSHGALPLSHSLHYGVNKLVVFRMSGQSSGEMEIFIDGFFAGSAPSVNLSLNSVDVFVGGDNEGKALANIQVAGVIGRAISNDEILSLVESFVDGDKGKCLFFESSTVMDSGFAYDDTSSSETVFKRNISNGSIYSVVNYEASDVQIYTGKTVSSYDVRFSVNVPTDPFNPVEYDGDLFSIGDGTNALLRFGFNSTGFYMADGSSVRIQTAIHSIPHSFPGFSVSFEVSSGTGTLSLKKFNDMTKTFDILHQSSVSFSYAINNSYIDADFEAVKDVLIMEE